MSELRRFLQKRRSKRYGACSDVAGANTLDSWFKSDQGPPRSEFSLMLISVLSQFLLHISQQICKIDSFDFTDPRQYVIIGVTFS